MIQILYDSMIQEPQTIDTQSVNGPTYDKWGA